MSGSQDVRTGSAPKTRVKSVSTCFSCSSRLKRAIDLVTGQYVHDVGVSEQQLAEVTLLVKGLHRVALHPDVRLLARDTAPGEFEQDLAGEDHAT